MIDCNITQNYLSEKRRMTKRKEPSTCRTCGIRCEDCPLVFTNNGKGVTCIELEMLYPEQAIELIQQWSDEHPQKTFLTKFLKHYPNTLLDDDGTPKGVCLYALGLINKDDCNNNCVKCWNQPVKDGEENNA